MSIRTKACNNARNRAVISASFLRNSDRSSSSQKIARRSFPLAVMWYQHPAHPIRNGLAIGTPRVRVSEINRSAAGETGGIVNHFLERGTLLSVRGGGISESRVGLRGRPTRAHNRWIKPRSNSIDFQQKIDNLDLTLPSCHPTNRPRGSNSRLSHRGRDICH